MEDIETKQQTRFTNILISSVGALLLLLLGWVKSDVNEIKSELKSIREQSTQNTDAIGFYKGELDGFKNDEKEIWGSINELKQKTYFLKPDEIKIKYHNN